MEQRIGSLDAGKLADFVVLAADPLNVDLSKIYEIAVERTYLGGKLRWLRDGAPPPLSPD